MSPIGANPPRRQRTESITSIVDPMMEIAAVHGVRPVELWTSPSGRPEPFGPCGQPMDNILVAHRLPTLSGLSPTSSTGPNNKIKEWMMTLFNAPVLRLLLISPDRGLDNGSTSLGKRLTKDCEG